MWKGIITKRNVEGNCSALGAPQNVRQNIYDRPRLSVCHEFGFGPKRTLFFSTSSSALIFSPILAFAHLLSPPTAPAGRDPNEPSAPRATTSSTNSTEIPRGFRTNPSNSQDFVSAPGHSLRKFVKKATIFLTFSLAPDPFPFDPVGPVLYWCSRLCFSSKGAVLGGPQSRIRLWRHRFDRKIKESWLWG